MCRVWQAAGVGCPRGRIAKIPGPAYQRYATGGNALVVELRNAALACIAETKGCRGGCPYGDDLLVAAFAALDGACAKLNVIGPAACIGMDDLPCPPDVQGGVVAIAKVPVPTAERAARAGKGAIGKGYGMGTAERYAGAEVNCRAGDYGHRLGHCILAAAGIGDGQKYRKSTALAVDMHGIGQCGSCPVAKIPAPAGGGGHVHYCAAGKLRGIDRTSCLEGKTYGWRRGDGQCPGDAVATAIGRVHYQDCRVGPCHAVGMCRVGKGTVVGGPRGGIAKIPLPQSDTATAVAL